MAAIELLKQQHRDVEQIFAELKGADRRRRIALLGKLAEDVTVHATLEERFLYPVAERYPELKALILEARREHAQVRGWISEIMELKSRDPRIDQLIAQVERAVTAHVAEEERSLFPRLEADPVALAEMGAQMKQAEETLKQQELLKAAESETVPQA